MTGEEGLTMTGKKGLAKTDAVASYERWTLAMLASFPELRADAVVALAAHRPLRHWAPMPRIG